MKKQFFILMALSALLVLSACGGTKSEGADTSGNSGSVTEEVAKQDTEANAAEETTAAPEETEKKDETAPAKKPGEKFTLEDWEIVLDSFEFNEKVSDGMFSSSADEGNKFLVLNYTVTNNGKEAKDFTAMFGGVKMKAVFKGEYEYDYTITMIDGDMSSGSIKPLASKTGFVVMEVPDSVAESDESLIVKLEQGEKAEIALR